MKEGAHMEKKERFFGSGYGIPPGSLVHIGQKKVEKAEMSLMAYNAGDIDERAIDRVEDLADTGKSDSIRWININGLHEVKILEDIGNIFGIHPLVLEDILNTRQRPRIQVYDGYLYMVLKMLDYDPLSGEITAEQLSLVLKDGVLLSFQERPGDVLDPIRRRLVTKPGGKIRSSGADYLAYSIVDVIVDRYLYILDMIDEKLGNLEETLLNDPSEKCVQDIYSVTRQLIRLRQAAWPLKEQISGLRKGTDDLIEEGTMIFLGDLNDHVVQIIDTIENYRAIATGLLNLYLSSESNKMNEIMRILTVISTIFIPLTFISGVYGMNFKYMPELMLRWAYPVCWLVIISIGLGMVLWFRRKKWL